MGGWIVQWNGRWVNGEIARLLRRMDTAALDSTTFQSTTFDSTTLDSTILDTTTLDSTTLDSTIDLVFANHLNPA